MLDEVKTVIEEADRLTEDHVEDKQENANNCEGMVSIINNQNSN